MTFTDEERRKLPLWAQRKVQQLEEANEHLERQVINARYGILGEGEWQGLALHSHRSGLVSLPHEWNVRWYFGRQASEVNYLEIGVVAGNNRRRAHLRIRNTSGMPVMTLPEAGNAVLVAGMEDFGI